MIKPNSMAELSLSPTEFGMTDHARAPTGARRVGYVDGTIGDAEQLAVLGSLFANTSFESVGPVWPEHTPQHFEVLFVAVDGASGEQVAETVRRLRTRSMSTHIVVVLRGADIANTRLLMREGAADVLPAPVSDAALALSLERLLSRESVEAIPGRKPGQVVALLKAGGGVGATALGVQIAGMLATKAGRNAQVCLADLDLQFGCAGLYFDLQDVLTIADCLPVGDLLGETQFATSLAKHASGARVLAAPRQLTPLDALNSHLAEQLLSGLKRDFALTIVDLPSVWTTWTNRVLQLADRIVLVTQLSVPHVHLTRRQLSVLTLQKLDDKPLLLVCNGLSSEQQKQIPLKSAQRALGRDFDHVIPEDRQTMVEAINRGMQLSTLRRGTKLEKAIAALANDVAADALAGVSMQALR
jgi:pilus assembly protein CpaE